MLLSTSGFVTICPKKEVEVGADKHLHRADHAEELRLEVQFEAPSATGNQYAFLPGGAVRALNPSSSMTLAETSNCIAVFKGNLLNKAELALQVTGCPPHVTEAQLLLHLYEAMGIDMLSRLNGQYAFCLYDSKQARVLAARDHSGVVPLLEGRTAAGSLIIACGTYLPEGTSQMTDIKAGEYKYGWHALPRAFKCGHRVIAGRASCDYGIRRRSIDAYNAPPARQSVDLPRQASMDIPRQRQPHHQPHFSNSYGHTPGKYMPPHLAASAAAAAGGASSSNNGFFIRQRATSYDGHHLQQQQHNNHSTPPAVGGRRRSETNTVHHGNRQPQHHHDQQQWMPKSPVVASTAAAEEEIAATVVSRPPPVEVNVYPDEQQREVVVTPGGAAAVSTPCSATSSDHHRRRRRHHRRRSCSTANTATGAAAAALDDDAHSEADSHVSSSTHDSVNLSMPGPLSPAASIGKGSAKVRQASRDGAAASAAAKTKGSAKKNHMQSAAGSIAGQHKQLQQSCEQHVTGGGGGFKRNSSCGELAALGGSPVPHSVLLAAPQGLAC